MNKMFYDNSNLSAFFTIKSEEIVNNMWFFHMIEKLKHKY